MAEWSKALVWNTRKHRFESYFVLGGITQLVECWLVTSKVASSSLVSPEHYLPNYQYYKTVIVLFIVRCYSLARETTSKTITSIGKRSSLYLLNIFFVYTLFTLNFIKMKETTINKKIIYIVLNLLITFFFLVPIYIILYSNEVQVYMNDENHTHTAKYLIWINATILMVLTYWKLKVRDESLFARLPLIFSQIFLNGMGLLSIPKFYALHMSSKNTYKNGYNLSKEIYIEHNWTTQQIAERIMIELNRFSNYLSLQEKQLILEQSLALKKMEQSVMFAQVRIQEIINNHEKTPNKTFSWFGWIYDNVTWSLTSDAYYAGYILIAAVLGVSAYSVHSLMKSSQEAVFENVNQIILEPIALQKLATAIIKTPIMGDSSNRHSVEQKLAMHDVDLILKGEKLKDLDEQIEIGNALVEEMGKIIGQLAKFKK